MIPLTATQKAVSAGLLVVTALAWAWGFGS
jgi:hypothetical protein